jgi:flagellar motor switch protein FliN/FliY
VELGRTTISVKELKNLRKGQILGLDKLIGDSLGIYANGKKLGSGEAVSVSQDRYGVRVMALVEDNDQPDELPP